MRCLLISVKRNRRGQPVREGHIVSGEVLTIGRASDCAIYLPDARVNLQHAIIRTQEDGRLVIEANNTPININGAIARGAHLRPATRITIGPYEMVVELAGAEGYPEHDFALTLEQLHTPAQDDLPAKARPTTLAQTWLSKRIPALLCALVIGAVFLLWPILHATRPDFRAAEAAGPFHKLAADESWTPGSLAAGHRGFGGDCKVCHTMPFVHVQDRECASCHESTGTHIADPVLQRAAFGTTRCAECHRDHRGLASMNDIDPVMCVQCHGNLRARGISSTLPNISDFKIDHPPFKLSIRTGPKQADVVRVEQSQKTPIRQDTGLKFPHDIHLAKIGVESHAAPPGQNGRVVLDCRDCHVAEESGVGFRPVTMEKHCANCHRLEFEPDVTSRQVPHGSERNVLLMLREFYASEALGTTPLEVTTVDGLLRRPPQRAAEIRQRQAAAWATEKAQRVAVDLFEVRVCVVCHDVLRNAAPTMENVSSQAPIALPWKIRPVFLTQHWLPKARFEHSKHGAVACTDCHDVKTSRNSSDVSMPAIGTCRDCHVGATPERHKISSNCEMCHDFHRHAPAAMPGSSASVAAARALYPQTNGGLESSAPNLDPASTR